MPKIIKYYNPNISLTMEFLLMESDGETPTDLTGATFRMHIRKNLDDLDIIATASTSNGKITQVTDGISIVLDASDTLAMSSVGYRCGADLEITYPSGNISPEIIEFEFLINKSYTRDYDTN